MGLQILPIAVDKELASDQENGGDINIPSVVELNLNPCPCLAKILKAMKLTEHIDEFVLRGFCRNLVAIPPINRLSPKGANFAAILLVGITQGIEGVLDMLAGFSLA